MKKRVALLMTGIMIALTACGSQQTAQEPAAETAQTAQETPAETTADAAETTAASETPEGYVEDMVLSTDLFTLTMPDEFKGKFLASIDGNMISIYDKECNEAGFGGYAFSVVADKGENILPGGMYTKVGELAAPNGDIYVVCKGGPSDVQWDYTKYTDMAEVENYNKLYNSADSLISTITANDGGTFMYGAGIKGEDLYSYILSKYMEAFSSDWDANQYEEAGISPEFYAILQSEGEKGLDEIGFAYADISNDGIDELLVGPIDASDEGSVVYDIYTMVDRDPKLVVSGSARNRYYGMTYGGVANEYSNGADESGIDVSIIEPNTSNLMPQYSIKYDGYTDEKNPWFIRYGSDENYEPMTEDDFNERMELAQSEYLKLNYTPFSQITPIDYSKVDLSKYGTFTEMLSDFKTGMGYANVKVGDTDVFLASTGTYNGENNTKNAIDASVFMYDENGKIVYLGQIESGGTAYPVMVADGCLFTGGHHYVVKNTVKNGKLVAVEEAQESYDTDANVTYYYGKDGGKMEKVEDDSNLTRLFDEYFNGEPVDFSVEKP